MAQKEVEDIFAKSMKKSEFKRASTVRLAWEFLNKHKAISNDWKNQDPATMLAEVADDSVEEETGNDSLSKPGYRQSSSIRRGMEMEIEINEDDNREFEP